jgi:sensor domain CHASE-containing protein
MTITKKTALLILGTLIPLFVVIFLVSDFFAYKGFEGLEKKNAEQNLLRGTEAISAKFDGLHGCWRKIGPIG